MWEQTGFTQEERRWVGRCKREGTLEKARGLYGLKVLSEQGGLEVARGGREEAASLTQGAGAA